MRSSLPAATLGVFLTSLVAFAAATTTTPTPAPTAVPAPETAATSDAAARHAKRTACIKEAKIKKLVGADKNSYIKECVAGH
jgi:hypothetical protein